MKKSLKCWIALAAAVLVVSFVCLNILAYNHARAMTHFKSDGLRTDKPENLGTWSKVRILFGGVKIPRPAANGSPLDLAPDCNALKINSRSNITLGAWYCDRGKTTPLVILLHGYSADKTSLLNEARAFLNLGTSVMLVDFRGSGESSEAYTTIGVLEAEDVETIVRFARQNLSHSSIVLFGQSMGAVAILMAIRDQSIQPDAVILEAVFDTMLNTVRNRFRTMSLPSFPSAELLVFWGGKQWGFNGFRHNPMNYASAVRCPALFMHGQDDPRARLEEGRRVFNAIPGDKEFVTFQNTGHESYVASHPIEWQAAVAHTLRITASKRLGEPPSNMR